MIGSRVVVAVVGRVAEDPAVTHLRERRDVRRQLLTRRRERAAPRRASRDRVAGLDDLVDVVVCEAAARPRRTPRVPRPGRARCPRG